MIISFPTVRVIFSELKLCVWPLQGMEEKYALAFCGNLLPGFIGSPDYSTLIYSHR